MGAKRKRGADKEASQRRAEEKLDALYAQLPRLKCKGKCWEVCTRIIMTPAERERIRREAGVEIPPPAQMARDGCKTCPALKGRKCTVYELRPMICRLWGIDETMRCEFGCKPEGGWLSRLDAVRFSTRSHMIGGWPEDSPRLTPKQVAELIHRGESGNVFVNMREEHLDRPVLEEDGTAGFNPLRRLRRRK